MIKALARAAIGLVPAKASLLRFGGRLPRWAKGAWSVRLFSAIGRQTRGPFPMATNLGLPGRLRVTLPSTASAVYVFGTPNQYDGERGALHLAMVLSRHADAFVDVGAHYGYFALAVAQTSGRLPIYAFEPNRALLEVIERNVAVNGLTQIRCFPSAVGDIDGVAVFHINTDDPLSSSLTEQFAASHVTTRVEVPVERFATFAARHGLTRALVKIDVEHAEFAFLEGAVAARQQIGWLIVEVLGPAIERGFITAARDGLGMEPYYIDDFRLEHAPTGAFRYVAPEYNWLFCRHAPAELARLLAGTRFTVVDAGGRDVTPNTAV